MFMLMAKGKSTNKIMEVLYKLFDSHLLILHQPNEVMWLSLASRETELPHKLWEDTAKSLFPKSAVLQVSMRCLKILT